MQYVPMPEGMSRPETGAMQFGDDWPGVFIRGDNALALALILQQAWDHPDWMQTVMVGPQYLGLIETLQECQAAALSTPQPSADAPPEPGARPLPETTRRRTP